MSMYGRMLLNPDYGSSDRFVQTKERWRWRDGFFRCYVCNCSLNDRTVNWAGKTDVPLCQKHRGQ